MKIKLENWKVLREKGLEIDSADFDLFNRKVTVIESGYLTTKRFGTRVLLQRIIGERILGRPLFHEERINFKDGNKLNIRRDNLVIENGSLEREKAKCGISIYKDEKKNRRVARLYELMLYPGIQFDEADLEQLSEQTWKMVFDKSRINIISSSWSKERGSFSMSMGPYLLYEDHWVKENERIIYLDGDKFNFKRSNMAVIEVREKRELIKVEPEPFIFFLQGDILNYKENNV